MTQVTPTRPIPPLNAPPSVVRQYLEASLLERFELDPEEAASTAALWRLGDGEELRLEGFYHLQNGQRRRISPGFDKFGTELGPRLEKYVRGQLFKEWQSSSSGKFTGSKSSLWHEIVEDFILLMSI